MRHYAILRRPFFFSPTSNRTATTRSRSDLVVLLSPTSFTRASWTTSKNTQEPKSSSSTIRSKARSRDNQNRNQNRDAIWNSGKSQGVHQPATDRPTESKWGANLTLDSPGDEESANHDRHRRRLLHYRHDTICHITFSWQGSRGGSDINSILTTGEKTREPLKGFTESHHQWLMVADQSRTAWSNICCSACFTNKRRSAPSSSRHPPFLVANLKCAYNWRGKASPAAKIVVVRVAVSWMARTLVS